MHNGHVGAFRSIRRHLLAGLSEEAFDVVQGSTDSEHVFAVFMDELLAADGEEPHALAACLNRAVWRVLSLVREHGGDRPSYLNLAVTDGDRAAACRFTSDATRAPESLYLIERELYRPVAKDLPGRRPAEHSTTFVVSSERLTDDAAWRAVEPNHILSIAREGAPAVFAMRPDGLVAA
jgi:predicted glutamine amidotransferase